LYIITGKNNNRHIDGDFMNKESGKVDEGLKDAVNDSRNQNENDAQVLNDILGYGKEIELLKGIDKETNKKVIKKYHLAPVSLAKMPKLTTLLNKFFDGDDDEFSDERINIAGEILKLSLEKMHPDITVEEILDSFTLGTLSKGIRYVVDLNDFLSEMQKLGREMSGISATQTLAKIPQGKKSQ
jgi:hypothetical protein